jgi:hypothetical protein
MGKMKRYQDKKQVKQASKPIQKVKPETVTIIFLGLILIFIGYIRIRLLSFPLERDEGEYAYFGQLILQGFPPYSLAYNLKLPGTYYSYAFIMFLFGQTTVGIHMGLLLINLGSIVLLFLIAKKLFNDFVAILAAASFGVLGCSPAMLGQAAHATHFVTFFMLAGVYLLILAFEKNKLHHYLLSGAMMGMAFLMKQSGIFFTIFGCVMIALFCLSTSKMLLSGMLRFACYVVGFFIPIGLIFLIMYFSGVFEKFWFWTMTYPGVYAARIPVSEAWTYFTMSFIPIVKSSMGLWIGAALGAFSLFFYPGKIRSRIFTGVFLFFSLLTVMPGFYFRSHYFIPFLPVIGILCGVVLDLLNQKIQKSFSFITYVSGFIFFLLVANTLASNKEYYFTNDPVMLCKRIYAGNPFTESIPIAKYLEENTTEKDKVCVFGSEPQIYFYAKRHAASGFIYMYDLVFDHKYVNKLQEEMFRDVEKAKPRFIVFVSCPFSWLPEKGASDTVFSWIDAYIRENRYLPTCIADISNDGSTNYIWNEEALRYRPQSGTNITVLKRPD